MWCCETRSPRHHAYVLVQLLRSIREALMIKTPFLPGEIEEAAAQNKWTFKLDAPPTPSGN